MKTYLKRFQPLLELYWRNKQVDLHRLVDENLRNPQDSLINTIELFNYQKELFNTKLPLTQDIGLIQVDAKSARNTVQPTPEAYLKQISIFIPQVIRERNEIAKKWIKENFVKLDKTVNDVEEYVEQSQYYNYTSENFQEFRDKVGLYGEFYNILEDKQLKVQKQDKE